MGDYRFTGRIHRDSMISGQEIADWRKNRPDPLSQMELAEMLGISQSMLSRIERGEPASPKIMFLFEQLRNERRHPSDMIVRTKRHSERSNQDSEQNSLAIDVRLLLENYRPNGNPLQDICAEWLSEYEKAPKSAELSLILIGQDRFREYVLGRFSETLKMIELQQINVTLEIIEGPALGIMMLNRKRSAKMERSLRRALFQHQNPASADTQTRMIDFWFDDRSEHDAQPWLNSKLQSIPKQPDSIIRITVPRLGSFFGLSKTRAGYKAQAERKVRIVVPQASDFIRCSFDGPFGQMTRMICYCSGLNELEEESANSHFRLQARVSDGRQAVITPPQDYCIDEPIRRFSAASASLIDDIHNIAIDREKSNITALIKLIENSWDASTSTQWQHHPTQSAKYHALIRSTIKSLLIGRRQQHESASDFREKIVRTCVFLIFEFFTDGLPEKTRIVAENFLRRNLTALQGLVNRQVKANPDATMMLESIYEVDKQAIEDIADFISKTMHDTADEMQRSLQQWVMGEANC